VRIVCVGSPLRGDDAAGLLVADHVRDAAPAGVEVVSAPRDAAALLDALDGAADVVVVDAAVDVEPGRLVRHDAVAGPLPFTRDPSSHGLGVAEAIELVRALGRLPPRVTVYGIGAASFDVGAPPSEEVAAAAERLARELVGSY
jgi:hydrogenase maturation protease